MFAIEGLTSFSTSILPAHIAYLLFGCCIRTDFLVAGILK
jgi:hypothetical protein